MSVVYPLLNIWLSLLSSAASPLTSIPLLPPPHYPGLPLLILPVAADYLPVSEGAQQETDGTLKLGHLRKV